MNELTLLRSRIMELERAEVEREHAKAALLLQVQQQAEIAKLGLTALASHAADDLLTEAVRVVKETLDVDYAKVLELLPESGKLLLRAGVGWRTGFVGQATVGAGMESQAGYTLASAAPVIVDDLRTEPRFSGPPLLRDHGVVSGLSVIIHARNGPIGVLGAHSRQRRTFTDNDIHFLQAVANVVAATLEREHLENERRRLERREEEARQGAERTAAQLRELRAVRDPHLAERAINDVLKRLLDLLKSMLKAERAAILLPDEQGQLVFGVVVGLGEEDAEVSIPVGKGIAGRIAEDDKPLIVDDLSTVEVFNPSLREAGIRSVIGVPLRIGERRGVVEVGSLASQHFAEDDIRLLERVADLVSTALEQVWGGEEERTVRTSHDATSLFEAAWDEDATIQGVARLAVPDLADFCIVHAIGHDGRFRRAAIAHADNGEEPILLQATDGFDLVAGTGPGPLAEVVRTGQVQIVETVNEKTLQAFVVNTERQQQLADLGPKSAMVVPLIARGRTVGAMTCVTTDSTLRYGPVDIALAQSLAWQAALAIDNARLFREVRSAEARYRSLFERVGDAMILLGPDGRYLDANPAASDLLGYTRQEFRRLRQGDLVAGGAEWSREQFSRLVRDGVWRGETELRHKDGSLVPAEGQAQQVVLPGGVAYIGMWRDISKRRAVEELQRDFLASVSHDLRTPLTALSASINLLGAATAGRLAPCETDLLQNAWRNTKRLGQLIADLLAYNELKSGAVRLDRESVDVGELVADVISTLQPLLQEKNQSVSLHLPDSLFVYADRSRLEQVLTNLVMNAHRHTPPGTRITIDGGRRSGTVGIAVRDNGPGIPPAQLRAIFNRFHRVHSDSGGMGLGLAIAKQLSELLGGQIWAENDSGGGSVFRIDLPVAQSKGGE